MANFTIAHRLNTALSEKWVLVHTYESEQGYWRLARVADLYHHLNGVGLKITRPSLAAWFSGTTVNPDYDRLTAAAQWLEVELDWLRHGQGPMRAKGYVPPEERQKDAPSVAAAAKPTRAASLANLSAFVLTPPDHSLTPVAAEVQSAEGEVPLAQDPSLMQAQGRWIPVIGRARGGPDDCYYEDYMAPGDCDGWVLMAINDAAAFGVHLDGVSMQPRFNPTDILIVTPSIPPAAGDNVAVRLKDGRRMIKRLAYVRDGYVRLDSLNDTYPALTIAAKDFCEEGGMLYIITSVPRKLFFRKV